MDLEIIRRVMTLMDELGVNLAGVEVILRMSQQITQLQKMTEELEQEIDRLRKEEK
jgi:MerR family transcriptional regulator/heat shock protein HspR